MAALLERKDENILLYKCNIFFFWQEIKLFP